MDFLIADTFTASLARLTGDEQKAVKTAAFDLQLNPAQPGLNLHKLDHAKDKNFWSARVSSDLRLILHRTSQRVVLCYVAHHDAAYRWAEARKIETHPKTGAAQLVELRETVREIVTPQYLAAPTKQPFRQLKEETLLAYGVPAEWVSDVQQWDEDTLLAQAERLPGEAANALLELATGSYPSVLARLDADPFAHPDAQRRFRLIGDQDELARALDYPWDKWMIFLHPAQRQLVEQHFAGPARVAGSAGTGKTIVALHRAVFLAQQPAEGRVLLTTFSPTLANALRQKLRRLISHTPQLAERLEVHDLNALGLRLYERHFGQPQLVDPTDLNNWLLAAAANAGPAVAKFSRNFWLSEWEELVDAWQLTTWEAYRDVKRLGRKTRLTETQRAAAWQVFATVRQQLQTVGALTLGTVFTRLAQHLAAQQLAPFDHLVVDEAQDVSAPQLRLLAALGAARPNGLFFAGDLGQRIFQPPFSWKTLGVEVRGRSRTLHINYRTSHQIRQQADRLLAPELADVDGNRENRRGTISVFNGPVPSIQTFASQAAETHAVSAWLTAQQQAGVAPHEIGVFVRTAAEFARAQAALRQAQLPFTILTERMDTLTDHVALSPMHLAKGLEFRAVVVMACDDDILPLQARIASVGDASDLEDAYTTERHLLYVACTRARDQLLVTATQPASEFLADLQAGAN